MADHYRVALRSAVVSRLTGLVTSDNRVFDNRIYPLQGDDLPGLTIKVQEPEIMQMTVHSPVMLDRKVQVVVRGFAKATDDLSLLLDTMGYEVEVALSSTITVGSKSIYLELRSVNMDAVQADQPVGMIEMIYDTRVYTEANTPETLR